MPARNNSHAHAHAHAHAQPNVLILMGDQHRWDALGALPTDLSRGSVRG